MPDPSQPSPANLEAILLAATPQLKTLQAWELEGRKKRGGAKCQELSGVSQAGGWSALRVTWN